MRGQWILSILSVLVSMGLLVIILGQKQVLTMLEDGRENLQVQIKKLDERLTNEEFFKIALEKLVVQGSKALEDLEATVAKLGPEVEKKKTENDACQTEKKTKTEELAGTEKMHNETEGSLKLESDAWNKEIDSLKAQLMGHRPICAYLKPGTIAVKLCGIITTLTPAVSETTLITQ